MEQLITQFRTRYPEFMKIDDGRVSMAIDDAQVLMSRKVWDKFYHQGLSALAAHLLYTAVGLENDVHGGEPLQNIASQSAGGLSVSYSGGNQGLANEYGSYSLTSYGQRYLELRKLVGIHTLVVP